MSNPLPAFLQDRRVLLGLGGGLALALGMGAAFLMSLDKAPAQAPPASQGGLVVQTGRDDDVKLDQKRPLRCFVDGKFVGELTLDECAKRNGVASGALDVGVDPSGALAASDGPAPNITPLPTRPDAPAIVAPSAPTAAPVQPAATAAPIVATPTGPIGACWRSEAGQWTRLPSDMSLNACVQALYAGRCEHHGAAYGRWIDQTLRAVPGRIEVSRDNHSFRTLVEQGPSCAVPPIG